LAHLLEATIRPFFDRTRKFGSALAEDVLHLLDKPRPMPRRHVVPSDVELDGCGQTVTLCIRHLGKHLDGEPRSCSEHARKHGPRIVLGVLLQDSLPKGHGPRLRSINQQAQDGVAQFDAQFRPLGEPERKISQHVWGLGLPEGGSQ
jgi:hypothetical protein